MAVLGQLSIGEAGGTARTLIVQDTMTIGRDSDNDIVLDELTVSRQHALLLPAADGLRLIDLGSTNGTRVNGVPMPPDESRPLADGDVIQLGQVLARYSAAPQACDRRGLR